MLTVPSSEGALGAPAPVDKLEFGEDIHRTKSYIRHSEAAIAAVGIRYTKGYLRIATALRASQ